MTSARATDPGTSHEAARSISTVAVSRIHLAILMILSPWANGDIPIVMTDEQIANQIRAANDTLARYSDTNFRSRRAELVKMGFVAQQTNMYGETRSGRRANLWKLTTSGLNHLNGVT